MSLLLVISLQLHVDEEKRSLYVATGWKLFNAILCVGANDYFSIVFQKTAVTAELVTQYIQDAMGQLYSKGARRCAPLPSFWWMGLPSQSRSCCLQAFAVEGHAIAHYKESV